MKAFGTSGTENGGLELWHLMLTFFVGMTAESPCAGRDNRAWIDLWRETGEFKEGHQVVLGCPEVLRPRRPSAYTAQHYIDRRLDDSAGECWSIGRSPSYIRFIQGPHEAQCLLEDMTIPWGVVLS